MQLPLRIIALNALMIAASGSNLYGSSNQNQDRSYRTESIKGYFFFGLIVFSIGIFAYIVSRKNTAVTEEEIEKILQATEKVKKVSDTETIELLTNSLKEYSSEVAKNVEEILNAETQSAEQKIEIFKKTKPLISQIQEKIASIEQQYLEFQSEIPDHIKSVITDARSALLSFDKLEKLYEQAVNTTAS